MIKLSSILDYQQQELCPEIWNGFVLKPEIKEFLWFLLKSFYDSQDLKGYDEWIAEGIIASSLATYFYNENTDFDIKVFIDLDVLIEYNPHLTKFTDDQILEIMKKEGRKSYYLTQVIPGTNHQVDFYFLPASDLQHLNMLKYDSVYLLSKDEWLKEPQKLVEGLSPAYIMQVAREKAEPYLKKISEDIEQTKDDCLDFLVLRDFLKDLDPQDLNSLREEFERQLDIIEYDIDQLVEDKNEMKEIRKREYDRKSLKTELEKLMGSLNYSDGNLIFKLVQRYGYLKILVEIKELYEDKNIVSSDVENILSLLTATAVNEENRKYADVISDIIKKYQQFFTDEQMQYILNVVPRSFIPWVFRELKNYILELRTDETDDEPPPFNKETVQYAFQDRNLLADIDNWVKYLTFFVDNKQKIKEKGLVVNINDYTLDDLKWVVYNFDPSIKYTSYVNQEKLNNSDADIVYDDQYWTIYAMYDEETACILGEGTDLCTTRGKFHDYYTQNNPIYMLLNKTDNHRWQFDKKSMMFVTEDDESVNFKTFFDTYNEQISNELTQKLYELSGKSIFMYVNDKNSIEYQFGLVGLDYNKFVEVQQTQPNLTPGEAIYKIEDAYYSSIESILNVYHTYLSVLGKDLADSYLLAKLEDWHHQGIHELKYQLHLIISGQNNGLEDIEYYQELLNILHEIS